MHLHIKINQDFAEFKSDNQINDLDKIDQSLQFDPVEYQKFQKKFNKTYCDKNGVFKFKKNSYIRKMKRIQFDEQKELEEQEKQKIRNTMVQCLNQQISQKSSLKSPQNKTPKHKFQEPKQQLIQDMLKIKGKKINIYKLFLVLLTKQSFQHIKQKNLETLFERIRGQTKDEIYEKAVSEINRIAFEMSLVLKKFELELQSLRHQNQGLVDKQNEFLRQIDLERQKNAEQLKIIQELNIKFDQLKSDSKVMHKFVKQFQKLSEQNITLDELLKENQSLRQSGVDIANQLSNLSSIVLANNQEKSELIAKHNEQLTKIVQNDNNREHAQLVFMEQLELQRLEYTESKKYKDMYLKMHQALMNLFNKWRMNEIVFPIDAKDGGPSCDIENPMLLINMLDKMIQISTPDKMQIYLRGIMVSSSQLLRKHFEDNVSDKFNPQKIYKLVNDLIDKINEQNKQQKLEIQEYKLKMEQQGQTIRQLNMKINQAKIK